MDARIFWELHQADEAVIEDGHPKSLVRKNFDDQGQAHYTSIVGAPWRNKKGVVVGGG